MVYQVSEQAKFHRTTRNPVCDRTDDQEYCEASFGHILKIEGEKITCARCPATWEMEKSA